MTALKRKLGILISVGLVLAIVAVAVKLVTGPLYRRWDARQCQDAYAAARTLAESTVVDLHPYGARSRSRNARCGEVRATTGVKAGSVCGDIADSTEDPAALRAELFPAAGDTTAALDAAAMRAQWYPALRSSDPIELELSAESCRQALMALGDREPLAPDALTLKRGVNVRVLRVGPYWQVDLWASPPPGLVLTGGGSTWIVERATRRVIAGPLVGL